MNIVLAVLALGSIAAVEARTCRVRTTADSGANSLRDCLERANGADVDKFLIVFARNLAGQTIENDSGDDYPQVTGENELIIRGPRGGITIEALVPSAQDDTRLPVVFWTGANTDLSISHVTVAGGFECVRMSETLDTNEPGDTEDVNLTLEDFHCSQASGSGLFVNENIGFFHFDSSSFTNCGGNGININTAFTGDVEEDAYEISFTNVKCNDNTRWGTFIDLLSAPAGGTVTVSRYEGNNNGVYGMELYDNGEGRMDVPYVQFSTFNNNREGLEFINADVHLIRACEMNDNTQYGLGLEQSHLGELKRSVITGNGEYGIDLEALASVESIESTKISGNADGVIKCGPEPSTARSSRSDVSPSN